MSVLTNCSGEPGLKYKMLGKKLIKNSLCSSNPTIAHFSQSVGTFFLCLFHLSGEKFTVL